MPYYRGDYYRGDYYRGDPFLGAIVRGAVKLGAPLVKKAASWAGRQITGSAGRAVARDAVTGAVAGAAGMALQRRLSQPSTGLMPIPQLESGGGSWGGERKKYRRMNPLNPKALRRALRRAEGFEKFARKTVSGLRYGPKKFKSQRRAS